MKCPSLVSNMDRYDKQGTHWWSILDLHPKKEVFSFNTFGLKGLKHFIMQGDIKIINQILYGLDLNKQTKINSCRYKFFQNRIQKTCKQIIGKNKFSVNRHVCGISAIFVQKFICAIL